MKKDDIVVYCPSCKRKITSVSKERTTDLYTRCANCGKGIIYRIETQKVEKRQMLIRNTSSGKRFN